jgi:hypothetical protein
MELGDSHKLEFPPATAALFHLVPQSELDRRVKAGTYDTVETCEDDDEDVQAFGLSRLYSQQMKIEDRACAVFWNKIPANAGTSLETSGRPTSRKRAYQRGHWRLTILMWGVIEVSEAARDYEAVGRREAQRLYLGILASFGLLMTAAWKLN